MSRSKTCIVVCQSRLAAEKEFERLNFVHPCRFSVPKHISQNRDFVAMSMIKGAELVDLTEIADPLRNTG